MLHCPADSSKGPGDLRYGQTMAFTTLMLFQIFNVVNARSDERSAFVHLFTNGWLWASIGGVGDSAGARRIRAVPTKRLRYDHAERRRLAPVCGYRKLGPVARELNKLLTRATSRNADGSGQSNLQIGPNRSVPLHNESSDPH